MNMKLEVVIVPVSDVDRAKALYEKLGFRLDIDLGDENLHVIQCTPPRSEASIIFGQRVTSTSPGSAELVLAVDDVDAARNDLMPQLTGGYHVVAPTTPDYGDNLALPPNEFDDTSDGQLVIEENTLYGRTIYFTRFQGTTQRN